MQKWLLDSFLTGHFLRSLRSDGARTARSGQQHFLRSLRSQEEEEGGAREVRAAGQHFLRSLRASYEDADSGENDLSDYYYLSDYLDMDKRAGGQAHFLRQEVAGAGTTYVPGYLQSPSLFQDPEGRRRRGALPQEPAGRRRGLALPAQPEERRGLALPQESQGRGGGLTLPQEPEGGRHRARGRRGEEEGQRALPQDALDVRRQRGILEADDAFMLHRFVSLRSVSTKAGCCTSQRSLHREREYIYSTTHSRNENDECPTHICIQSNNNCVFALFELTSTYYLLWKKALPLD